MPFHTANYSGSSGRPGIPERLFRWSPVLFSLVLVPACSANAPDALTPSPIVGGCPVHFASVFNRSHASAEMPAPDDGAASDRLLPVRFSEEEFDNGRFWDLARPDRLRIPQDGTYSLRLRTNFERRSRSKEKTRTSRVLAFTVNDRIVHRETYYNPAHSSGYWPTLESNLKLKLEAGDFAGARIGGTSEDGSTIAAQAVDVYIRRLCDED